MKERKPGLPPMNIGRMEPERANVKLPKMKEGNPYDTDTDPVVHLRKPYAKYRRVPDFTPARDAPSEVATLCGQWVALDKAVRHDHSLLTPNVCNECMFNRDLVNVFGEKKDGRQTASETRGNGTASESLDAGDYNQLPTKKAKAKAGASANQNLQSDTEEEEGS